MRATRAPGPLAAAPLDEADTVAVVHWPEEADIRHALAAAGAPRLLLVGPDDPPPLVWDDREDWVREGAGPAERTARSLRLARRTLAEAEADVVVVAPVLDADGVLHRTDGSVAVIPPVEAAVLAELLDRPGEVLRREDLLAAGWPGRDRPDGALDGRIRTLRSRLAGTGLAIRTVRGVGYLLELG